MCWLRALLNCGGYEDLIKYSFPVKQEIFLRLSLYGFRCIQVDSLRRASIL